MSVRRKGPKDIPKLPLSLFSPPNTSAGDSFNLPPTAGHIHPTKIIDANLTTKDVSYRRWEQEVGDVVAAKTTGIVISLPEASDLQTALTASKSLAESKVISLIVPFDLRKPDISLESIISSTNVPVSLSTVLSSSDVAGAVEGLRWALKTGKPVDIDVQAILSDVLENFVDLIAQASTGLENVPPIILSNILPPSHVLDIQIVRLMTHPTYLGFQTQIATLSLISQVYIKFLPPDWNAPTPQTPFPGSPVETVDAQQMKEWKRRIKMYLAPVIEAFGSERIIYGSSPSQLSRTPSNAGDWYEIARESLVETGIEQSLIDNIFYANAEKVYGRR